MLQIAARGVVSLVSAPPRQTAERLRFRFAEIARERKLGIRTAVEDPENGSPTEYQPYVPAPYLCLDAAFAAAGIEPGRDSFLDYGCGKGRVVCVAATLPFARVIGIELRLELIDLAAANLARLRGRRCGAAELVTGDAVAYEVPDDVSVICMFNPFTRNVLRSALERVRESLSRRPRPLRIAYMNPTEDEDLLAGCGWLERRAELPPGRWTNMRFGLYTARATD